MEGCIFCKIAAGEIPAQVVYEDEQIMAFKDVKPAAPVHILVIPKRHIPGVAALAESDKELIGHIMLTIKNLAQEMSLTDSGYRAVVNQGENAGQSVPHLHYHLLGGRLLGWPPG